jgi:hypothetical protein
MKGAFFKFLATRKNEAAIIHAHVSDDDEDDT